MSKYLLNKFLFTVDRDPELVERYRDGPGGTVAWWEAEQRQPASSTATAARRRPGWRSPTPNARRWPPTTTSTLFELGAHPFLTLTLFIAMFERDHAEPLAFQLEYARRLAHFTLPVPRHRDLSRSDRPPPLLPTSLRRQLPAARLAHRPRQASRAASRPGCGRRSCGASTPTSSTRPRTTPRCSRSARRNGAGLDIVTDGEIRRESYSNHFATALDGVDIDNPGTRARPQRAPEPGAARRRARSGAGTRSRCAT